MDLGYSLLAEIHTKKGNIGEAVSNLETALRFQRSPYDMLKYAELIYNTSPSKAKALLETVELYEPFNTSVKLLIEKISSLQSTDSEETLLKHSENNEISSELASLLEDETVPNDSGDTEKSSNITPPEKKAKDTSGFGIFPPSMKNNESVEEVPSDAALVDKPIDSTEAQVVNIETKPSVDSSVEEEMPEIASAEDIQEIPSLEETFSEADSSDFSEESILASAQSTIVTEDKEGKQNEPQTEEIPHDNILDSVQNDQSESFDSGYFSNIEPDLPGYSEILGETENPAVEEQDETGVIELNGDESFDIAKLDFDISNEEPILTEEEKAELLSFDDEIKPADFENELLSEDSGLSSEVKKVDSEDSKIKNEQSIMESFYGLSEDELLDLNEIKTDIDISDRGLETETVEGIDYSDILYGVDKNFGNEDIDDKILTEIFREADIDEKTGDTPESEDINAFIEETGFDIRENRIIPVDNIETDDDIATKLADELGFDSQKKIENEIPEDDKPFEEELLGDIIDDLIQDQTTPVEVTEEIYEMSQTPEFHDDNLVEEILNSQDESLDKLLDDYIGILKESPNPDHIEHIEELPVSKIKIPEFEEPHFIKNNGHDDNYSYSEISSEEDYPDFGEATATMAEIFVSQGLVTRALDIYKSLHQKDPSNEKIKERLENLRKSAEEQS